MKKICKQEINKGKVGRGLGEVHGRLERFPTKWKQSDEVLIYGVNKSEEIEEARKKEAGGVRDLQQGVMQLTQSRKRVTGLNHTHQPHIIILLFFLWPVLLLFSHLSCRPSRVNWAFSSIEPFTSLCVLDKKRKLAILPCLQWISYMIIYAVWQKLLSAELKVMHQAIYREKLWASLIRVHKKGLAQLHKNRNSRCNICGILINTAKNRFCCHLSEHDVPGERFK